MLKWLKLLDADFNPLQTSRNELSLENWQKSMETVRPAIDPFFVLIGLTSIHQLFG